MSDNSSANEFPTAVQLDCCGLRCPLPLLRAKQAMSKLAVSEDLHLLATDRGALKDIPAWCELAGLRLHRQWQTEEGVLHFLIRKT